MPGNINVNETPDGALMQEVQQGRLASLATLFEKHHRPLFHFFHRLNGNQALSEDLVQEVFFRMLKYRSTFQPERPFTAWMYQIARNAQTDSLRKRKFEVALGDDDIEHRDADRPDEKLSQRQEAGLLRKALQRLPEEKREVLVLSRFQNLKYEEIASILGCEVGTVKVRVYRAVRALAQEYRQLAGEKA